MFKNILVPLDGSYLAEFALPVALIFAKKYNAAITLVHIVENNPPGKVHGQHHLQNYDEAVSYLNKIASSLAEPEIEIKCHVHDNSKNDVVQSIVGHHTELAIDLIIMTTHGWGGFKGIIFGNIAQQIITLGNIPVLFIPPVLNRPDINNYFIKNILIPIDGTEEHEAGLSFAIDIAKNFASELHLLLVIPTLYTQRSKNQSISIFLPATFREILNLNKNKADSYIRDKIEQIEKMGIKVSGEVKRGNPPAIIAKIINKRNVRLIVLSTHGKAGLSAFWAESVAAKITSKVRNPILFVPIKELKTGT